MLVLRLFKSYIFSKRSESLLRALAKITLISSSLTVFALVVVASIMNGFNRNMALKLLAVEPHISFSTEALKKDLPAGSQISSFEEQDVVVRTLDGLFSGAIARGLTAEDVDHMLDRLESAAARVAADRSKSLGQNEIFLGVELARNLNVLEGDELSLVAPESLLLPAGELIPIERVRIAGIIQSDVTTFDSQAVIYNKDFGLSKLARNRTRVSKTEIRLEDPNQADQVVEELSLSESANPRTWRSANLPLFFALRMEKWAMMLLLGLSVLVTSFSIIMLLLMLITEKRKDIGIFMAMGLSRQRVTAIFTGIGFLLASLGSIGGLAIGTSVAIYLEGNPIAFMPAIYTDTTLPAEVQWLQVIAIAGFLLVLSYLAAWLPVRQLTSGTPSENLSGRITPKR